MAKQVGNAIGCENERKDEIVIHALTIKEAESFVRRARVLL